MFKKLKDKITEEVKQSPLKSVQQLASAVVSPSSSSVFEPSSNDHFCIDDDDNQDASQNLPVKSVTGGFTTVNLLGQVSSPPSHEIQHSRRSSVSSVTSDVSSIFPRYEPSSIHFQLQSDLESASEMEDSALSLQIERINKENLYEAYRKLRVRYNKYKGRFVDLAEHYRRLEKENAKCKNILSETQDKALRRISELREQCNLEQEAKAHLEEALRSDLEEKDHLIATLNTKIELLKSGSELEGSPDTPAAITTDSVGNAEQLAALQEKVKKLEALLMKCKTVITEKNVLIEKQQKELDSVKVSNNEKLTTLTKDLTDARSEIESLQQTVSSLKKNEEEAALSLAENKLSIHQELEKRDEQIKKLKSNIEELNKDKEDLCSKAKQLEDELKVASDFGKERTSDEERSEFIQELSRGKSEAVKLMQQKLISVEQTFNEKLKAKEIELEVILKEHDILKQNVKIFEEKMSSGEVKLLDCNLNTGNGSDNLVNDVSQVNCNNNICQNKLEKEISNRNSLETQILDKEKEIERIQNECRLIIEEKDSEINKLSAIIDDLTTKNNELNQLNTNLLSKDESREKELFFLKEAKEKLLEEKEFLNKNFESHNEKLNLMNSELLLLKNSCSSKTEELLKMKEEKDFMTSRISSLEEKCKQVDELECKLSIKEKDISSLETSFHHQVSEKLTKINNLEVLNNAVQLELSEKENVIIQINNNLQSVVKEKTTLVEQLTTKTDEINSLKSATEIEKLQFQACIQKLEDRCSALKNEIDNKEKLLSEKVLEFHDFQLKLNNSGEDIKLMKDEIDLNNDKLKNLMEQSDLKDVFLKKFFLDVKAMINSSNFSEILRNYECFSNDERNVGRFPEIQENCKYILSAISDMKKLVSVNENELKRLSDDLQRKHETNENMKQKLLSVESFNETQSFENHKLTKSILHQLQSVKTIKNQQNELNSVVSTFSSEFVNNLNLIQIEVDKLKTLYYMIEESSSSKSEKKNAELEKFKGVIGKLRIQLKDKDNKLKKYCDMENKLELIESEKKTYENEIIDLKSTIYELESEVSVLKDTCNQLKEKLENQKTRCVLMESELKETADKLNSELSKYDSLKSELLIKERDHKIALEVKDRELSSVIDELVIKDNKFEEEIGKRDKEIENLKIKLRKAEKDQSDSLENNQTEVLHFKEKASMVEKELSDQLQLRNHEIEDLLKALTNKDVEIEDLKVSISKLSDTNKLLEDKSNLLKKEVSDLKTNISGLEEDIENKREEVSELKIDCERFKDELEVLTNRHENDLKFVEQNFDQKFSNEIIKIQNESAAEIETLKMSLSVAESKNYDLQIALNESELQIKKLEQDINDLKKREEEHCNKIHFLTTQVQKSSAVQENKDLSKAENKDDHKRLKEENEKLRSKLNDSEEKQADKIKELVFDFNLKLSQKDEEMKSIESYNFDKRQAEEDFIAMELKQQIKDLQQEMETRGDAFEKLLEEHKEMIKSRENDTAELKKSHDIELREHDKKWRACLDRRLAETEAKYKEEIEELSKEWNTERKFENNIKKEKQDVNEELEYSNRLAVAAMESGVNSTELLRKQVTALTQQLDEEKRQHKREASELQRLLVLKKNLKKSKNPDLTVEDCTEMEYLRNILYEYMMGKEPLVLAKVLSAIVKFDAEQTNKVLQKEEQKITLLGQLGLS